MKLFLAQHGPAVEKTVNRDRPLSEEGRLEVAGVARYLKQADANISGIYHSGKTRAQQTAAIFANELGINDIGQLDGINPNDDIEPVVAQIDKLTDDTMIVSHLPFLPRIVSRLLTGKTQSEASSMPGNIICLDRDNDGYWSLAGCCTYSSFDKTQEQDSL